MYFKWKMFLETCILIKDDKCWDLQWKIKRKKIQIEHSCILISRSNKAVNYKTVHRPFHFLNSRSQPNLYIFNHALKIQPNCLGIIISVLRPWDTSIIENILVITYKTIMLPGMFELPNKYHDQVNQRSSKMHTPGRSWYQNFCPRKISLYQSCT